MSYRTGYVGASAPTLGRTFVAGYYYTGMQSGADAAIVTAQNTEYAVRFEVGSVATTFDRIGLEVTTGAATAVMRLGIRYDSGGLPATLLLDAGTIDATGAAYAEITISQLLTPGRWWVTATCQGNSGVQVRGRPNDNFIGQSITSTINNVSYAVTGHTTTLPAAFGTLAPSGAGPKILLRAA